MRFARERTELFIDACNYVAYINLEAMFMTSCMYCTTKINTPTSILNTLAMPIPLVVPRRRGICKSKIKLKNEAAKEPSTARIFSSISFAGPLLDLEEVVLIQTCATGYHSRPGRWSFKRRVHSHIQQPNLQSVLAHQVDELARLRCNGCLIEEHQ